MSEAYTLALSDGTAYPYKIVHSKRAKYIRIKLTQQGDLSVTLPAFTQLRSAHEFVFSKAQWIEKNLAKVKKPKIKSRPDSLHLELLNEIWDVQYSEIENPNEKLSLQEQDDFTLIVCGNFDQFNDLSNVSNALNHWCKKKPKIFSMLCYKN